MKNTSNTQTPTVLSAALESLLAQAKAQGIVDELLLKIRQEIDTQMVVAKREASDWLKNLAIMTDAYKGSHYLQYPKDATGMFWYLEARGGEFEKTVFFGLQMILKEYLSKRITVRDVEEAKEFWEEVGVPFDYDGFMYIVNECDGYFPLKIYAVDEGAAVPTSVPLIRIECLDPRVYWCGGILEALIMQVWYPITVATLSWDCKSILRSYMQATADDDKMAGLDYMLHDFGFRGATSPESAARGGAAHLVNFRGTDTNPGILAAKRYYNAKKPGCSIPAAEHSTITAWGRDFEFDAYENMVETFSKPGFAFAVVSDSYDLDNAVINGWGGSKLMTKVLEKGGLLVVRPDSGDPETIVIRTLFNLERAYGSTINTKGYRVLNGVRIIQGDGVNRRSIRNILAAIKAAGFSAENVAFGMGGGLLQDVSRDTCKFAMKASAILRNGVWQDVFKDPITDKGKRSKKGRVTTFVNDEGQFTYGLIGKAPAGYSDAMSLVWSGGTLMRDTKYSVICERAEVAGKTAKSRELALGV